MAALLSVDEVKDHLATDLDDAALSLIIDAEEAEIVRRFGPHAQSGTVSEFHAGYNRRLYLHRPATAITSVVEEWPYYGLGTDIVTLTPDDYTLRGNRFLERVNGMWGRYVTVVYTPVSDDAQRKIVLIQLVKLAMAYTGLETELVGDTEITYREHFAERETVLRQLARGGLR